MFDINISTDELDRVAADFIATEKQVDRALSSTLGKMAKWLKTRSVKGLKHELNLPTRVLSRRIKVKRASNRGLGKSISIFYGEDPISVIFLNARQTSTGVSAVGGRRIQGAFIRKTKKGRLEVFKRNGKARMPVTAQEESIQDKTNNFLTSRFFEAAEFERQFYAVFEREMAWRTRT